MTNFLYKTVMAGALAFALGIPAGAATVYSLNVDGCSSSCGTAPFGTVTLNQFDSDTVQVSVALKNNEVFAGTGAGVSLAFNLSGVSGVTLTDIPTGFQQVAGPVSASTFGSFGYGVECTVCQGGQMTNPPGPLSFSVNGTGITEASFTANNSGYFFASDIAASLGDRVVRTGNVGSNAGKQVVPEPATTALIGAGLLGLVAARKKITL